MAVAIRFKMVGRKNRPCFRLVATELRNPRDGRTLETLGHYDPLVGDEAKSFTVDAERVKYWISVGARPTDSARQFLRTRGILVPAQTAEAKRRRERHRGRGRAAAAKRRAAAAKAAGKK